MSKWLPGLVAFLGGAIIMVLEVIGARFLAKDFGSAFHVWVSQIGVVLIALALGYYLGGTLADRWQRFTPLAGLLGLAGFWTLAIPEFADAAIEAIVTRHPAGAPIPALWLKLDPVLGSSVVFLLPCLGVATLSPCMIRLATTSLARIGRSSGAIIAASTLGSVAGVFLAGYVLVEQMRISHIFRATGLVTLGVALLCLWMDRLSGLSVSGPGAASRPTRSGGRP